MRWARIEFTSCNFMLVEHEVTNKQAKLVATEIFKAQVVQLCESNWYYRYVSLGRDLMQRYVNK